jgi:hypothetical protein
MEHSLRWTKRRAVDWVGTTQTRSKPNPATGAVKGEGWKFSLKKNPKIKMGWGWRGRKRPKNRGYQVNRLALGPPGGEGGGGGEEDEGEMALSARDENLVLNV